MKRFLGLVICLSLALPCSAAPASPDSSGRKKTELRLEPKAGLPQQTIHFTVEGYGTTANNKAQLLETIYQDFLAVTGLTTLEMPEKVRVLIFENQKEFKAKMRGSRKAAAVGDHTLATFEQPTLDRVLVTNLSDMLLEVYLGRPPEKDLRWLKRGISEALMVRGSGEDATEARERWRNHLKNFRPVTLEQLVGGEALNSEEDATAPTDLRKRRTGKDSPAKRFQVSSTSLVMFLSEWGGRLNFAFFLAQLRGRKTLDDAIAASFPGKFRNMTELYNFWLVQEVGDLKNPAPNRK